MKIHEYQAKNLFAAYHIPVERSILCHNVKEAVRAYGQLGKPQVVIKAQVLSGGRGKAGGIRLASNAGEVAKAAAAVLGMNIKGLIVDRILVAEAVSIASEYYVGLTIDRNSKSVVLISSREGGVDIEETARMAPTKINRFVIDPSVGIPDFLARRVAFSLFDSMFVIREATAIIQRLYTLFMEKDTSLAEINPLVLTKTGEVLAIDAKMTFDDNALFRHPDIEALFEPDEEEQKEKEAKSKGFSYVRMDGNIGCMVNGAGLAMATMDIIKLFGGEPANFLDIGGSSNPVKIVDAMKLLLSDTRVKVVLINIFGGITRCDDVAAGLMQAFGEIHMNVPVVVRLTGTNEHEGRNLLRNSPFIVAETMEAAAQKSISSITNSQT